MQVPSMVNESLQILDNKYISAMIGLFLALYAGLAAPKLPKYITIYFDNPMFKLGVMFLIAYMATKDPPVAIIASVALLVSLQTLSSQKTTDKVVKAVKSKVNTIKSEVEKSKYLKEITEGFADDLDEEEDSNEEDYEPLVKPSVEQTVEKSVEQTVEKTVELKQIDEVMKPITEQVIKKQEVTIPIQVQADAATEAAVQAHAEAAAQAQAAEKAAAQAQAAEKAAAQAAEEKMKAELIAQAQAAQAAQAQVAAAQAQAQAQAAQVQAAQEPNGCGQVVNTTISGYDLNAEYASY